MRFESHATEFLDGIERDFGTALEDAADMADRLPGSPSDLRADRTSPTSGRIGSSRAYAMAQEKGAFIQPRRARALRFADGRFRRWARIPGQHYLERTGRAWSDIVAPRLRRS